MQYIDLPPDLGNVLRRDLRDWQLEALGRCGVTVLIPYSDIAVIPDNDPTDHIHTGGRLHDRLQQHEGH
jgi:hypothetical protein